MSRKHDNTPCNQGGTHHNAKPDHSTRRHKSPQFDEVDLVCEWCQGKFGTTLVKK